MTSVDDMTALFILPQGGEVTAQQVDACNKQFATTDAPYRLYPGVDGVLWLYSVARKEVYGYEVDLYVAQASIEALQCITRPTIGDAQVYINTISVMNGKEAVYVHRGAAEYLYGGYQRFLESQKLHEQQQARRQQLDVITQRIERLVTAGYPVSRIMKKLRAVEQDMDLNDAHVSHEWINKKTVGRLTNGLRSLESEVAGLESIDLATALVNALMAGEIMPSVKRHNDDVKRRVEVFNIRTNGYGDSLTEDDVREFYLQYAQSVASLQEFERLATKLRLAASTYIILDESVFGDDEIAPVSLKLAGAKGKLREFAVSYALEEHDGKQIPVGTITVPYAVAVKYVAEYAKKSTFPELAFGIQLQVRVECKPGDDQPVVGWANDETLKTRAANRKKGLNRAADNPDYALEAQLSVRGTRRR